MRIFYNTGRYFLLMARSFRRPQKYSMFWRQLVKEIDTIGLGSLGIVSIISIFMGAVITLQTSANIDSALIPAYTVGFTVRQSMILEFSTTIIALILSGKVGSNIASEVGTMRVGEQIDALEIMGINSANYLILPKNLAAMFIFPFLTILSMAIGIAGGYLIAMLTGVVSTADYTYGVQFDFNSFHVTYALIKAVIFGFIITSISSYHGYYTGGGALEVGESSTRAVVYSSVVVLIFNYIITQLLLI